MVFMVISSAAWRDFISYAAGNGTEIKSKFYSLGAEIAFGEISHPGGNTCTLA